MADQSTSAAAPVEPTFNVFFGNLPFDATAETLKGFFPNDPNVLSAKIIKRSTRSLGYGFVEFKTEPSAKAAVENWNKKLLGERELNVELAKAREAKPEGASNNAAAGEGSARRGRGSRGAGRGAPRDGAAAAAAAGAPATGAAPNAAPRAPRGAGRGRRGENKPESTGESSTAASGEASTGDQEKPNRRRRSSRGRGAGRGGRATNADGTPAAAAAAPAENKAPEVPKVESKTLLFVANLPFSVNDESLKSQLFAGFNVAKAYVVVAKRTGRSKGFGFVELANEEEANKALSVDNKEIEGRVVSVKKALVAENAAAPTN